MWYVGATRARELLVIPRHPDPKGWANVVSFDLSGVNDYDPGDPAKRSTLERPEDNHQTLTIFADEKQRLRQETRRTVFVAPSRSEGEILEGTGLTEDLSGALLDDEDGEEIAEALSPAHASAGTALKGGAVRGLVIHKLFEEVLNGETPEMSDRLAARAADLLHQLGSSVQEFSPTDIADCVIRGFGLAEIRSVRPMLKPEWAVYALDPGDGKDLVTYGIADAVAVSKDGVIDLVVDWKSDVQPTDKIKAGYREQVRSYLKATGARRGLIVFVTTGEVLEVKP